MSTVRVLHLAKSFIRPKPDRDDASSATPLEILGTCAKPFGFSGRVVILNAARTALLEMVSPAAAQAMLDHHAKVPLLLGGRSVTLERSSEEVREASFSHLSDAAVLSQCLRCVEKLLAALERAEAAENSLRRKTRHAAHLATLNRAFSAQRFDRSICWAHYQRKDGCERRRCGQGRCPLSHEPSQLSVRFCCAPPRLRTFFETETYPAEYREGSEEKLRVNAALVYHALEHVAQAHVTAMEMRASRQHLPSPFRCLVLDGPGARTAKELLACANLGLTSERIDCPNLCTATFEALRGSGTCIPYLGSLRALLDSHRCPRHAPPETMVAGCSCGAQIEGRFVPSSKRKYALAYMDYCCGLYAGRTQLELSPLQDLCSLFTSGLLACRSVLAVTLARPSAEKPRFPEEALAAVNEAMTELATCDAAHSQCSDDTRQDDRTCEACVPSLSLPSQDLDEAVLEWVVEQLAGATGMSANLSDSFDFSNTFVRVWRLSRFGASSQSIISSAHQ